MKVDFLEKVSCLIRVLLRQLSVVVLVVREKYYEACQGDVAGIEGSMVMCGRRTSNPKNEL